MRALVDVSFCVAIVVAAMSCRLVDRFRLWFCGLKTISEFGDQRDTYSMTVEQTPLSWHAFPVISVSSDFSDSWSTEKKRIIIRREIISIWPSLIPMKFDAKIVLHTWNKHYCDF